MNYKLILFAILMIASYVSVAWAGSRKYKKKYEAKKREAERYNSMWTSTNLSLNQITRERISDSQKHLAEAEASRRAIEKAAEDRSKAIKEAEEFKKLYTDELAKNWALVQKCEKIDVLVDMPDTGTSDKETQ